MEVRGMSDAEIDEVNAELQKLYSEGRLTMLVSESSLARDWATPEEDEAWKDL